MTSVMFVVDVMCGIYLVFTWVRVYSHLF